MNIFLFFEILLIKELKMTIMCIERTLNNCIIKEFNRYDDIEYRKVMPRCNCKR